MRIWIYAHLAPLGLRLGMSLAWARSFIKPVYRWLAIAAYHVAATFAVISSALADRSR